jgi:hypothetical protein
MGNPIKLTVFEFVSFKKKSVYCFRYFIDAKINQFKLFLLTKLFTKKIFLGYAIILIGFFDNANLIFRISF